MTNLGIIINWRIVGVNIQDKQRQLKKCKTINK